MVNNIRRNVLVTGSEGFMGKNLIEILRQRDDITVLTYDVYNSIEELKNYLQKSDVVFHLAGVNRPQHDDEFIKGNTNLTDFIVKTILESDRKPLLVFSSSIQATLDNAYGKSKYLAEKSLEYYGEKGGWGIIIRLSNVFGKWSRPNYNSAVATFCYNIARGLDINVSDQNRYVDLVYIDDVVRTFMGLLENDQKIGTYRVEVSPVKNITLGELTGLIFKMRDIRSDLLLPDFNDPFVKKLYATYLSFLPSDAFAYSLLKREDQRGALAELLKSPNVGQIFVSRTKPGFTRGNHYHHTKVEKFCVLEGKAIIHYRHISHSEVISYRVDGSEFKVLDIPPGYTHSIENIGENDCIVLFWASEIFNSSRPDTYSLPVIEQA